MLNVEKINVDRVMLHGSPYPTPVITLCPFQTSTSHPLLKLVASCIVYINETHHENTEGLLNIFSSFEVDTLPFLGMGHFTPVQ